MLSANIPLFQSHVAEDTTFLLDQVPWSLAWSIKVSNGASVKHEFVIVGYGPQTMCN